MKGAAPLVREGLVSQGAAQWEAWRLPTGALAPEAQQLAAGRAQALKLTWGGHTL